MTSSPVNKKPRLVGPETDVATTIRHKPSVDFSKTREVGSTRWLRLETVSFTDETGQARVWDRSVRVTKAAEESVDAVAIFATLKEPAGEERVLLVKQFRPPANCYTIELPAGLIDAGETPGQAAVRELKEETGYIGVVQSISPLLLMSRKPNFLSA